MEYEEFRSVLVAFADTPADVDLQKGNLVAEVRGEMIEAKLFRRGGDLIVEEDEVQHNAASWIIKRVARLPILADRILTQVPEEPYFIEPAGRLLDRLEVSPRDDEDDEKALDCVTPAILESLGRRPEGTSTGLYVTSDAGEGKTTLIHHMARHQARQYKQKETDWLLLPIALGGRPFLRFDDVIIGTLVNTLRFPFLYYDALVWLVRMGVIVPALDGFEEMFVESQAGDAVSALGNLMRLLDSRGTILIAARSAFFEYKNLRAQAPLFDSFQDQSAEFARVRLEEWDRGRFVEYATKRGVHGGDGLFEEVAAKLKDESHPLLTRAVLVRRLVDVVSDGADRAKLIETIGADHERFFERFVESIMERESREKWIDRSGPPFRPLLLRSQHRDLLSEVAMEMWVNETAVLKSDIFDHIVDLYADSQGMAARITNQIHRRIRQHALIVTAVGTHNAFRFDHEEFYHYFLGEAVARTVAAADFPDIRRVFRIAKLPDLTIDVAARSILGGTLTGAQVIGTLNDACASEPLGSSLVKDNAGSLTARLIDSVKDANGVLVKRMTFAVDSLLGRSIQNAEFQDCYFLRTGLAGATMRDCLFERCQFGQIDFTGVSLINRCELRDCQVDSVVRSADETALFAPDMIDTVLERQGFEVPSRRQRTEHVGPMTINPDHSLVLTERMCQAFFRSTGVNENTLRQRMSKDANLFFKEVLPELVSHEVVKEVDYKGSGKQHRYRLGVSLRHVQESIEQADGRFEKFLQGIGG